jgi:hypothetical protein
VADADGVSVAEHARLGEANPVDVSPVRRPQVFDYQLAVRRALHARVSPRDFRIAFELAWALNLTAEDDLAVDRKRPPGIAPRDDVKRCSVHAVDPA